MNLKCKSNVLVWLSAGVILLWLANGLMKFVVGKPISDCGTFGDQFGAVNALFSGLAFVGLIYTIIQQNRSIELQRKDLKNQLRELQQNGKEMTAQTAQFQKQNDSMNLERFENRFFQMLQTHHENVMSMQVDGAHGRDCFEVFVKQLANLYYGVNKIQEEIESTSNSDIGEDQKRALAILSNMSSKEREDFAYFMAYGYLFYGTGYKSSYKKDSDAAFLSTIVNKAANSTEVAIITNSSMVNIPRSSQLGHYYRHLFQMVKFVNKHETIVFSQRYEYIKMIRAQLSDYEQVLLYYNAISPLGQPWIKPNQVCEGNVFDFSLLIGYRLIKNIPHFFKYFYCDPRDRFKDELKLWNSSHEENYFEQLEQFPEDYGK